MVEGGDVLVASPEVLLVGLSERTNRWGVEALVRGLRTAGTSFRHLVVVELPARRSYMHLDTVFTFIDEGTCLAYLPVIAPGGAEAGHVYSIDLAAEDLAYRLAKDLPTALHELGISIDLVPCGGDGSMIDQQREQWTDGANAFAIAPGVIVLYRRNRRTLDTLSRRGWRVLSEDDVLKRRVPVLGAGPTAITLLGNELARARGGPRCMTMPLERILPGG
jgi:arginine deiminase